jgi:hypothetical protein
MILDERLEFCDATALSTTATADVILGDVIDRGSTPTLTDLGTGEPIYLVIQVTTALAGATSLRIRLVSDSAAALTTSKTTHWDSGVIALSGNWAVGTVFVVAVPWDATVERYVGLWQNVVGTISAGAVNAFLTRNPAKWSAYADAL